MERKWVASGLDPKKPLFLEAPMENHCRIALPGLHTQGAGKSGLTSQALESGEPAFKKKGVPL